MLASQPIPILYPLPPSMYATTRMLPHRRAMSCQGVSFETSFRPPTKQADDDLNPKQGRWMWIPFGRGISYRDFIDSGYIRNSISQTSSHYCDVDAEVDNEDGGGRGSRVASHRIEEDIEEGDVEQKKAVETKKNNNSSRLSIILLDQGLFTVYKRLFAVVFALNMAGLGLVITGYLPDAKERAGLLSIANILALTLCRSEAFLRIVFWIAVKAVGRRGVPLSIKLAVTAFLQSVGGIHSSCGVSSVAWLVYALIITLNHRQESSTAIVAVASTILSLLSLCCLAAFPLVRHLHHNVFERTHRFAGWAALALLWAFVILTKGYDSETRLYNFGNSKLAKQPELWFTVAVTFFTLLPWVTVRRVPVKISAPSGHASLIKFPGGVPAGILGRISRSPLSEWHAFGIISDNQDSHMMLAGAVGDFTKGLVSDPPSHLWVRQVHFAGLPYLVNMYRRVVLVATGSGICVFLSFLLQPCAADVCVVWVAKDVEQNFGTEIQGMMSNHPPGKVIVHDTAVSGRPNVAELTIEAVKKWKAEVVVVTSNPQGSRDVVEACKAARIPAFGPIWDS